MKVKCNALLVSVQSPNILTFVDAEKAFMFLNFDADDFTRSRLDPGQREKINLNFYFPFFVVPQKIF